jgi:hypothetical protein
MAGKPAGGLQQPLSASASGPSRVGQLGTRSSNGSIPSRSALPPGMVEADDEPASSHSSNPDILTSGGDAGSMVHKRFQSLLESRMHSRMQSPMTDEDGGLIHRRGSSPGIDGHGDDGLVQDDNYDEGQECFHEVHAIPLLDPVLDKQVCDLYLA